MHIVGSCIQSREKSIQGWYCEVWCWEQHPSHLSVPSYFPECGRKQIVRRKYVWDCLDLWLLLLAEGVAKTLVQREQVVCWEGKGLHFMPLVCLLPLVCTCTGETQQSWTQFQPPDHSSPTLWIGGSSGKLLLFFH